LISLIEITSESNKIYTKLQIRFIFRFCKNVGNKWTHVCKKEKCSTYCILFIANNIRFSISLYLISKSLNYCERVSSNVNWKQTFSSSTFQTLIKNQRMHLIQMTRWTYETNCRSIIKLILSIWMSIWELSLLFQNWKELDF